MPELPEVESVRQGLEQLVVGKRIEAVTVLWENIIKDPSVDVFKRKIVGQRIESVGRRGKFLLFELTSDRLISHLRMEGKFKVEASDAPLTKHTHVLFSLDDGTDLRYLDVRKFGKMSLTPNLSAFDHPSLKELGPEPFEESLTVEQLQRFLNKRQRSIKSCLLDQKMVAGIGNIYADEILFRSHIHPERQANTLTMKEVTTLREAIVSIMTQAVASGGTTIRTYANAYGQEGSYQSQLMVYGKQGEPCPRCHTPIVKGKVAQRGTHYCPVCQTQKG